MSNPKEYESFRAARSTLASGNAESAAPMSAAEPPRPGPASTCIEHQAGRPTLRLSFQIKVF